MSKVFGSILILTPPLLHSMTKLQYDDSENIRSGVLLPCIGWKISKFLNVEPQVYVISYIDQFIPSPLNAHVPLGSSDNDILFGTQNYMQWTGEKCMYLNLGGLSKYKLYNNGRRVTSLTTFK